MTAPAPPRPDVLTRCRQLVAEAEKEAAAALAKVAAIRTLLGPGDDEPEVVHYDGGHISQTACGKRTGQKIVTTVIGDVNCHKCRHSGPYLNRVRAAITAPRGEVPQKIEIIPLEPKGIARRSRG